MLGRLTMLLLAALLLAGCGTEDEGATTVETDAATASGEEGTPIAGVGEPDDTGVPVAEQAEGTLRVELREVGAKDGAGLPVPAGIACTRSLPATCSETIECPVAEDGDPADQRVCGWLRDTGLELLLAEPPADEVCIEVYGGPEVATVTGTVDGQQVDATFSRENGCAIARFDAVAPLWTGVVNPDVPIADPGAGAAAGACPVITEPDAATSSSDPASGAADQACPGGSVTMEPQVVEDPPEAFEFEPSTR